MSTTPALAFAGDVTVICVSLTAVKGTLTAPNATAVVVFKPVPLIVTVVPPASGPSFVPSDVTVGTPA